jgi:hypothetical protein
MPHISHNNKICLTALDVIFIQKSLMHCSFHELLDMRSLEACSLGWRALCMFVVVLRVPNRLRAQPRNHSLSWRREISSLSLSREFNLLEYVPR